MEADWVANKEESDSAARGLHDVFEIMDNPPVQGEVSPSSRQFYEIPVVAKQNLIWWQLQVVTIELWFTRKTGSDRQWLSVHRIIGRLSVCWLYSIVNTL